MQVKTGDCKSRVLQSWLSGGGSFCFSFEADPFPITTHDTSRTLLPPCVYSHLPGGAVSCRPPPSLGGLLSVGAAGAVVDFAKLYFGGHPLHRPNHNTGVTCSGNEWFSGEESYKQWIIISAESHDHFFPLSHQKRPSSNILCHQTRNRVTFPECTSDVSSIIIRSLSWWRTLSQ